MADSEEVDTSWHVELETALIEGCDFGTLRSICKARPVPQHLKAEVWQICLSVYGKGDALAAFDELFDLAETHILRDDCHSLVDKLGNDAEDQISIVSDLESIVTFYCKSRNQPYHHDNGWLEILQPMLALKMSRADLYNAFYAMLTRYVPKECQKNGRPFHLFRLLLLYHDPELCSFLDSRRISPETYALSWFRSLFAAICDLKVILNMWDVYLQHADPFLVFFLALVIVVNAKEQIMSMQTESKQEIIEKMTSFPSALDAEDIEDFCSLAQYYSTRTPQSFRRDFQMPLFGTSLASQKHEGEPGAVSQMLCLPVSTKELLQANQVASTEEEEVRFFLVDCRPAEQYNAGHLPVAFHLDANLMLQNPTDFALAVQTLFSAQRQAMAAGSIAGGEHLCFMGSGRDEEDQYVHMVVAHFLQKNAQYVSLARGGYAALHLTLGPSTQASLADHNPRTCIMCNPDAAVSSDIENTDEFHDLREADSFLNKFSSVVKTKGAIMKEKLTNYIKNEQSLGERHVSSDDKVGPRYRNMASVFTIGDEDEEDAVVASSDDEHRDTVNIETWLNKPDVKHAFTCQQVRENGYMCPSHLLVTTTHLYVLREMPNKPGMALVQARRALGSIVKITSKKRHPELITFKYGSNDDDSGLKITDLDRFLIPKAGEATKVIKHEIMKVLDALES